MEDEFRGSRSRRPGGLLQERAEGLANAIFMSVVPELVNLLPKRRSGWFPVKDGEGLVGLVGMRLAFGPSGQVEEVGVRPGVQGEDSRRRCRRFLGLDFLFVLEPVFNTLVGVVGENYVVRRKNAHTL